MFEPDDHLTNVDLHAAADKEFGPCMFPECPGSVWARDGEPGIRAADHL